MRWSRLFILLTAVSLTFTPLPSSPSDLQIVSVSTTANIVVVKVRNPNTRSETARLRTTVRLIDRTSQTITGNVFTIAKGGTLVVNLYASKIIVGIDDDPVPINP